MKEFLYIFRGTKQNQEAYIKLSPEETQIQMQKWNAWMGELTKKGKLVGGQPLFPQGKVVKGVSKKITDGPFTEGKDIVGGYILIRANDLDEAVELSKECPTLDGPDGTVEIREIMPMQ